MSPGGGVSAVRTVAVPAEAKGQRLDAFLAAQLEGVSRSRVQTAP